MIFRLWELIWSWHWLNRRKSLFLLNSLENWSKFATVRTVSRTLEVNERGTHASALSWLDISLYLNFEAESNSYETVALWFWSFCQKWLIRCQKRTFTSTHMHSWIFRIVSQSRSSDVSDFSTNRIFGVSDESIFSRNWEDHQNARNNETSKSWQKAWIGRIMSAWNPRIRPK